MSFEPLSINPDTRNPRGKSCIVLLVPHSLYKKPPVPSTDPKRHQNVLHATAAAHVALDRLQPARGRVARLAPVRGRANGLAGADRRPRNVVRVAQSGRPGAGDERPVHGDVLLHVAAKTGHHAAAPAHVVPAAHRSGGDVGERSGGGGR